MKFISFLNNQNEERVGLLINNSIIDLQHSAVVTNNHLPATMADFLTDFFCNAKIAKIIEKDFLEGNAKIKTEKADNIRLLAPIPHPPSCRDGYAFRQHVVSMRKNRGAPMIPEFDQFPVFYFTNHHSIIGEGNVLVESDHLERLDFELEAAIVIGKKGRNIQASHADHYIAGYMIMNDFSGRLLQTEEMLLSLGPAKGKDFATAIGPWLVTPDELSPYKVPAHHGHIGDKYNLKMKAFHNGKQISEGYLKDMDWTFAEIIERASYGVELVPGDIIGSGTVGTGCYAELNGTSANLAKEKGETYKPIWLQTQDNIELEIEMLGRLKNTIIKNKPHYSILEKKKHASS